MFDLASNFVGVEPIEEFERWCGKEKVIESIPCPQIVQQYKKKKKNKYRARQGAGTKRYSGISLIW